MPPKKYTSKKRRQTRRPRRANSNGNPEWASGSFTRSLLNPNPVVAGHPEVFTPNTTYRLYDIAVDDFDRAVLLARAHQMYRINKVTMRFKPLIDTFAVGGSGDTLPNLYYQIDTQQALSANVGVDQLKQMGCKPHRFDDKTIVCKFTPGVLDQVNDTQQGGGSFAKRTLAPWLNTTEDPFANPITISTVDHKGITWCLEQTLGTSANYTVDIIVDMQFKKPAIEPSESVARALDAI